jgi:hypothetical protein
VIWIFVLALLLVCCSAFFSEMGELVFSLLGALFFCRKRFFCLSLMASDLWSLMTQGLRMSNTEFGRTYVNEITYTVLIIINQESSVEMNVCSPAQ